MVTSATEDAKGRSFKRVLGQAVSASAWPGAGKNPRHGRRGEICPCKDPLLIFFARKLYSPGSGETFGAEAKLGESLLLVCF